MGVTRNAHKSLYGNLKTRDQMKGLGLDGRIILKRL